MRALRWALLMLLVAHARATEITSVTPERQGAWLTLSIQARDLLDARTRSTVESGLPGTCVYRVDLIDEDEIIAGQRLLSYALRFDVWEELYRLEGPDGERAYSSLAEADSSWAHLNGVRVARLADLQANMRYRIRVHVAVRPIAPEDRLRVAEFVNQSSAGKNEEMHIDIGALFARLVGDAPQRAEESFQTPQFLPASLAETAQR